MATTSTTITSGVQYSGIWTMNQVNAALAAGTWTGLRLLYGSGRNNSQNPALGLNNTTNYSSPKQVSGGRTSWASVTAGTGFTLAIESGGALWSWGYGVTGALGYSASYVSSPKQVGALTNWLVAAAGYSGCSAIKTDGTLWSWGSSSFGQLGLGNITSYNSPKQVGALTTWASLARGYYHTLAVKTNGTIWSWGMNLYGQLGLGNTTDYSSPKQIGALTAWLSVACGFYHTIATKTDGTLWSWGRNNKGQLGLNNLTAYYVSPRQVGALTTWSKVACGNEHTIAIKTDGTLWAWGWNQYGQLGDGTATERSSPVQIGSLTTWSILGGSGFDCRTTTAIKTDGTLWAWGDNAYGQLGLGNVTTYSSPKQVGALTTWFAASRGRDHNMEAFTT